MMERGNGNGGNVYVEEFDVGGVDGSVCGSVGG